MSTAAVSTGRAKAGAVGLPWYVVAVVLAATSAVVGVIWDISWHRTIGRDTFWTPAHLAIYASGIIAGLSCGWLVLKTTFAGSDAERAAAVRFWGFRGPLGAWCSIWGALAMIVSAPFDNWWHNAYGLDVKILSPPHAVLTLGILGVAVAGVLLVLATMNRATGAQRDRLGWVLLVISGEILVPSMTASLAHTFRSNLRAQRRVRRRLLRVLRPARVVSHRAPLHARSRRRARHGRSARRRDGDQHDRPRARRPAPQGAPMKRVILLFLLLLPLRATAHV